MDEEGSLTERLGFLSGDDREKADAVLREIWPKLRQIAVAHLNRERRPGLPIPTELIHDTWLRSLRKGGWQIRDRGHFYSIAARAMRQVLVDFARKRLAQSRDGAMIPLEDVQGSLREVTARPDQVVEIGILMEQLEKKDLEISRIVDLHYFSGFTLEETGEITGQSLRQVRYCWEKGRDWLKNRM